MARGLSPLQQKILAVLDAAADRNARFNDPDHGYRRQNEIQHEVCGTYVTGLIERWGSDLVEVGSRELAQGDRANFRRALMALVDRGLVLRYEIPPEYAGPWRRGGGRGYRYALKKPVVIYGSAGKLPGLLCDW